MKDILYQEQELIDENIKVDLSELEMENYPTPTSGKYQYTHNIKVTEFADGYHVAYNRPTSPWWNYSGILMVIDSESNWRYARVTPEEYAGVVTIPLKPAPTDRIIYAIQIEQSSRNRTHVMPLVVWIKQ